MDLPVELRLSPWAFASRPEPPVEGCTRGIHLMHYQVRLIDGTFKLTNYLGDPLLEWDDWDEMLEMLNVWPQDERSKKMWDDHRSRTARLSQPSSGTSASSPTPAPSTAAEPTPERSAAGKRRGTSSAKSTKQR